MGPTGNRGVPGGGWGQASGQRQHAGEGHERNREGVQQIRHVSPPLVLPAAVSGSRRLSVARQADVTTASQGTSVMIVTGRSVSSLA